MSKHAPIITAIPPISPDQVSNKGNLRILYLISASQTPEKVNMNAYQRLYFLSRAFHLTVLAPAGTCFQGCVDPSTVIVRSRLKGSLGVLLSFLSQAFRTWGNFSADMVITEPSMLSLCGYLFRRLSGSPWIADVWDIPIRCAHGSVFRRWNASLLRRLCRVALWHADLYLVSIVPDLELKWFGLDPARQLLLNNAIWTNVIPESQADGSPALPPRTIFCMRTSHGPDMGLDTMADAFHSLKLSGSDVRLCIVGRVTVLAEHQVASLRKHPDVMFHDLVPHSKLLEMIQAAWVCVVPFRDVTDLAQTYPIKMLEYLAMGKVIVASRILGLSRMVNDGVNALLFEPGSSTDLARKITSLLHDNGLYRRLANDAHLPAGSTAPEKAHRIIEAIQCLATHAPTHSRH